MNIDDFRKMYVAELQEARSVERQLAGTLPRMAEKAAHADLKEALEAHLAETQSQLDRLDTLLDGHTAPIGRHEDQAMQAILGEAAKWLDMFEDQDLRDAGLVASAQRVEHYEMAVYGTLAAWARQLGLDDDAEVLHDILEEERKADAKLTEVATRILNPDAAH